ncbi:MAG: metal-dependent hydrolase [Acidobacteriota bacterium]
MASVFSHAAVALTLGRIKTRRQAMPPRFWVLSVCCAALPDADVVGFGLGIRYGDLLGHRGLSHALAFAVVVGVVVVSLAFRQERRFSRAWWALVAYFSIVTASHGVLDALTNGGLGVAFFSPLDPTRYFFPWRPIQVSPIGVGSFFSEWGLRVILSELVWIGLPCLVVLLALRIEKALRPQS